MKLTIARLAGSLLLCLSALAPFVRTGVASAQAGGAASAAEPERARRDVIDRSIQAIETECRNSAGGDWNKWFESLAPFRRGIQEQLQTGRARGGTFLLQASGNPPLFDDPNDLLYLWEEGDLDSWLKRRTTVEGVVQATQWLRRKNIDVIFVPVPKMTEVYPDSVAPNVPPDRIVAPQVRRLLLDLLKADVEVVDLLPLFLTAARQRDQPLYFSDDSHWAPRAQLIAAKAIAERLERYPFVKTALAQPALFHEKPIATTFGDGAWRPFVSAEQLPSVRDYSYSGVQILNMQDQPVAPLESSPVMMIGDSFATVALRPGMSLDALLARQINLQVSRLTASGGTVDSIKDFAREPELLRNSKVIVWVVYNGSVCSANSRWSLPNLP